ncbi:phosphoglucosamine mutase [Fusobacterium perfoetens]|uniref:phosphoglucosamine mutase n=1 Tax=Fusobacterium perfoetens TaxID=852 RepID=UPI0015A4D39D|nr:phosphoglucosamine mutase [Fusobacterium perfoetens]MCF2626422.1 phosphoglucosamine mutase [Fusobacterium perfoetens]
MRKYFGTDGIRGEANRELTAELAMKLGYALGYYLRQENPQKKKLKVIMGSDTRISGYMLRSALSAGLTAMGINIDFVGVIPTPGVAFITQAKGAEAGIMISASHNPAKDNGIKIFAKDGCKLPDEIELELEKLIDRYAEITAEPLAGDEVGKFKYAEDDYFLYRDHLKSIVNGDFSGMKIILDAANGSAYRAAKDVFLSLGAEIVVINDAPNGKNINVRCGSTHPEILSKVVMGYEADLGLAYDGDADRLIAVDRNGKIVDGDKIIATLAVDMKKKNILVNNRVVTTVMSNMGLESFLNDNGIVLVRANVGDRYVLEKMKSQGLNIGGEQSGHIILLDYGTTGDGIQSSLKLVEVVRDSGKTLDELVGLIPEWPQVLINVRVDNVKKNLWDKNENITSFIKEKEKFMGNEGRVLVRTSGTEPIVRVMVEGKNAESVKAIAEEIAEVVKKELA